MEIAVNLFTLMNSALGPLNPRLGFTPNRRFNRPKKTPAARPASISKRNCTTKPDRCEGSGRDDASMEFFEGYEAVTRETRSEWE
jgi:hypothetical protein